ncbi:hypothetical protein BDZ89DRAFT_1070630 [Hymenopellis radicata]|nr:hypothetical protein BDZ89DRAFT_1070630 [Hymenopellis radicata]
MSSPSPPDHALQVVHVDSLEAALTKLGIQVSMKDLLRTIHEMEEAKRKELYPFPPTGRLTPVAKFVEPNPNAPPDPARKERHRRLIELTKEAFPDGKMPEPFAINISPSLGTVPPF